MNKERQSSQTMRRSAQSFALILCFCVGCSSAQRAPAPSEVVAAKSAQEPNPSYSSSIVGVHDHENQAAHHFSLGQAYSLEGETDKAIEEYKLALVYDPKSAIIHTRLATEYVRRGLLTFAIEECKIALDLDAQYTDARLLLAGLYGATKLVNEAVNEYNKVIKQDPQNTEAYVFKGSLQLEEGRAADALETLKKLVAMDAESHLGHYYLGRTYQRLKKMDLAVQSYKRALEVKPSFSQAALALGQSYEEKGQTKQAIKVYEDLFAENRDIQVTAHLAQIYIDHKEYKQALKYLKAIEQMDVENLNIRVKIGLIYMELKEYELASKTFEEILAKNADAERVRFYLGGVYEELKDYDKAIDVFSKVESSSSSYDEAAVHIGYLYKLKGNTAKALNWINQAIDKNQQVAQYYTFKASLLEDEHQVSEAIELLEGVEKRFSKDERLLYYLGSLYEKTGRQDRALATMQRLLDVNPDNANALNYIGYTMAIKGGNMRVAETMVRRARQLKPHDGYIQDSYGYVLLRKGKHKEALKELEKAYAMRPDEPVIVEHLGDAYLHNQLLSKALEKYNEAFQLYADPQEKTKLGKKIDEIRSVPGMGLRLPAGNREIR